MLYFLKKVLMERFLYKHIDIVSWINCFCETYINCFPVIFDYLYGVIF
jgi:hypothetical protein